MAHGDKFSCASARFHRDGALREDRQHSTCQRSGCTKYHEMGKRWAISHSCGCQIFQALGLSHCTWNSCLGYLSLLVLPKSVICRSVILAPTSLFIHLLLLNKSFHLAPSPVWWRGLCTPADDINVVAAGSVVSVSHKNITSAPISVLFCTPYCGMRKNNMKKWRLWEAWICRSAFLVCSWCQGLGIFFF